MNIPKNPNLLSGDLQKALAIVGGVKVALTLNHAGNCLGRNPVKTYQYTHQGPAETQVLESPGTTDQSPDRHRNEREVTMQEPPLKRVEEGDQWGGQPGGGQPGGEGAIATISHY